MNNHPFPNKALENHIAILGKTGSGKTFTAKGIAEILLREGKRVCAIDPTSAWWGLRSGADGKKDGFPVVIFGGPKADVPLESGHGEAIAEIVGTTNTLAILDTRLLSVSDRTRFFADFAEGLLRKNVGPLHLIIDEAHLFAPQGRVSDPQSGKMLHAANNLVSLGRGIGLRIILITQRPAKLHKDSLTQVETLIAMRLIAPQDRRAVEDWIGEWADPKEGKAMLADLPSLPSGEGWIWSPQADVLKRVKFPMISTFDSSKAPQGAGEKGPAMAAIDLPDIEQRLKTISNDITESDPKVLRQRIAQLEAQKKPETIIDRKAIDQAREEGFKAGFTAAMKDIGAYASARESSQLCKPTYQMIIPDGAIDKEKAMEHKAVIKPSSVVIASEKSSLSVGEKKILIILAQYPQGCTRDQLTVMTGYKRSSRDTYLQRLKSQGYATGSGDELKATPEGIAALGSDYEPLPKGGELRQYWINRLGKGEGKILSLLIDHYPAPLSKEFVSKATDYQRASRDTYLQRLTSQKLVISPQKGYVRASDDLFT